MVSQETMRNVFCICLAALCFRCWAVGSDDRKVIQVSSAGSQMTTPNVTVSVTNDARGLGLVCLLMNEGVSELTINQSDLPWFPNGHTSLVLVPVNQPDRPIGPPVDWVSLLPGLKIGK